MSNKKSIGFVLGGLIAFVVAGCDNDQSKIDPEGPQPPPSNEEVDSAKATTPETEVEVVEIVEAVPMPAFDVSTLPGVPARDWSQTDGGSWFATVMPGTGDETVGNETGAVTVRISLWQEDGTPIFLSSEVVEDPVFPMGSDMFPGWNETLAGMRVNEVRKIAIPFEQTRILNGQGFVQTIGFDDEQMLIGDVKLVAVDAAEPESIPQPAVGS
ncbi:MAG: hypothetical protein CMJ39_12525 [Phycisphaerae bacterium]|nr:hypothetical protein [Phycisphaerae bacterium]